MKQYSLIYISPSNQQQNGIGENGTEKMVRTKWHGQNGQLN